MLCNGSKVAELENNRYIVLKAAAGTHNLTFRDKNVAAVVEAGREYHYRASLEGHWQFAQGPEVRLVGIEAAQAEMTAQEMRTNFARRADRRQVYRLESQEDPTHFSPSPSSCWR